MTTPSNSSRPQSSRSSQRPAGRSSWSGGSGNSRQGAPPSRPGIHLAALGLLLVVMLAAVIGGAFIHPSDWHSKFKVGLGLDLHGGTEVTLQAVAAHGGVPSKTDMNEAIGILTSRFNGLGINNTTVQQQGAQFINISIPGKSATQIKPLLSAAQLNFRQVLLCTSPIPGGTQCAPGIKKAGSGLPATGPPATPTPNPTPSTGASPGASSSPQASSSPKASASANPSPSASGGTGQAVSAHRLTAASPSPTASAPSSPSPSASAPSSASPSASPSGAGSPAPLPTPSASAPSATALFTIGDQTKVSPKALALFKKLNCRDPGWETAIYHNESFRYDGQAQIVSCDKSGIKYVLATPIVHGTEVKSPSAGLSSTNNQWLVTFNLTGAGSKSFGSATSQMVSQYYDATTGAQTSPLDQFAIVLDGKVISAPFVQQAITQGSGQISGNFTQKSATNLANVLKYGALPLSFSSQQINSVSAQLGSEQLSAGLIAAAIGLLLVVFYSLFYYRGLALVSVFSLASAAALSYLAVILLGKYQGYSLSLAGIAGLIVAIGITADSFIVYFERLRDEVREGRTLRAAVERGWGRARRTILVSDTVSFLAALLLYIFAIGDVKGFAFTLGLTTLIDVAVVFLFTKPMVTLLARTKFYSSGRPMSGLDPRRLGARSPLRGTRAPVTPKEA